MNQPLELWGGLECTVARIGNDFCDQSLETGHRDRIDASLPPRAANDDVPLTIPKSASRG